MTIRVRSSTFKDKPFYIVFYTCRSCLKGTNCLTSSERTVFLSLVGLGLHHSYPEQEAYRTKDRQRLQEPEQRSAVFKKERKKKKKITVLKLSLENQPYTESYPRTVRDWNNVGEFSQLLPSREGIISSGLMATTEDTTLLDSWPQLKSQLFSTHGHN